MTVLNPGVNTDIHATMLHKYEQKYISKFLILYKIYKKIKAASFKGLFLLSNYRNQMI